MNFVALDPNSGKPLAGDLVWSALPDAPVQEDRPRFPRLRALVARPAPQEVRRPTAPRTAPRPQAG